MGSSCFSRGNAQSLDRVESYLRKHNITDKVELKGRLCTGNCAKGPCISFNEKLYSEVHPNAVEDLLKFHIDEWKQESML